MGWKDALGDKPYVAPHNGTDTSKRAARKIEKLGKGLLAECLKLVQDKGMYGMTCDEAEAILEGRLGSSTHQTVSARFNDLANMGRIACKPDDREDRRPTRKGSPARIYRAIVG
jgi:hypothetical protein